MSNNFLVRQILKTGSNFFVGASIVIGALCPIVLTSSRALAGYAYTNNIPTDAANEIKTLDNKGITPNTIAFTPDGGWVILYNKNSAAWNNIPPDAANAILTLNKQGSTINTIAFTPKGQWIIIYNGNGVHWSGNFPQDAANAILTINKQGKTIDCVAFTSTGEWVIIGNEGYNAYLSKNFPQVVSNEINSILRRSVTQIFSIQSVVFAPNGGWGIIYNGGSNFTSSNIPQPLTYTINTELQFSQHPLVVAFTPKNGWVLEYGLVLYTPAYNPAN